MSNLGATTGKEPDHIEDEDLLSLEEMRGTMQDIKAAALTNSEKATVRGVLNEMEVLKDMMAKQDEQNNRLVNLYSTLRGEFDAFKVNYAASLNLKVAGGSTTPEDWNGANS